MAIAAPATAGTAPASRACCIELEAAKPAPQINEPIAAAAREPAPAAHTVAPVSIAEKKSSDVLSAPTRPTTRDATMFPTRPETPKTAKQAAISPALADAVRASNGPK